jgi:glycosyltransferase involved in cell wall biosynthesis
MSLHFSVIVPTYQRPAAIVDCIKALTFIRYPKDRFEVIVVDDGSSEPVEAVIRKFGGDVQLRVIRQPNAGPAAARNAGIKIARGEYLAFTDDDCMADGEWLNAFDRRFQAQPQACVGGPVANGIEGNSYSIASQLVSEHVREFFSETNSSLLFFTTNNIAFPAAALRQIGGFFERYRLVASEDREICYRWSASGGSLVWEPRARVIHAHDLMLRQFWIQHFTYGRGAYHYYQARRDWDGSWPRPLPRFYFSLLGKPLRQSCGFSGLRLVVLLGLSQMATVAGYLRERFFYPRSIREKNSQ